MLNNLKKDLRKCASPEKRKILQRFFKTGKGEYGEGDIFLGVVVPDSRKIANKYKDLTLAQIEELLNSKIHEERLVALFVLVNLFERVDEKVRDKIYRFYLAHTRNINNWDLVDTSAYKILGAYLWQNKNERRVLEKLARSENLWEKRIAIISTLYFIKQGYFEWTLKIAKILMKDEHDLIHKAVGWMLREVGKKDKNTLVEFLEKHKNSLPRTALRYAIERLPFLERKKMLK